MGRLHFLAALLSVVTISLAQTYTVKNNCPTAIDLHVGNLPVESLAVGATTVKTGLGPVAGPFYTTANNGLVGGNYVGSKAGFYLISPFWAYYVSREEADWFNAGISITPAIQEHDGFCKVAECNQGDCSTGSWGYPTLDQWSDPPAPDDGPIGPPIYQCKDANVDFTVTFCPTGAWPTRPSQVIHPDGDKSKCLDVRGAVFENGTPVQIYDCNGSAAQKWVFNVGSPHVPVRLAGTNFCLDAGSNPYNSQGVKLKIWDCYDGLLQQDWYHSPANGKIVLSQIRAGINGFCLDVTDGRFENSNEVQVWECTENNANQKWTIE
ncbi:G-X-X-X-Q-X-W domain-containing protein [Coprinopsis sp. MPI-PUGE-AT-0042]|nr:G-X-X-X-Q-X-W domain-containing protein [Coprinopsis sp. MPI-PUGE-AT-0042]